MASQTATPTVPTLALAAVVLIVVTVLVTSYLHRAKGPADVPGQPQVIAQDAVLNLLDQLADHFEAAGEEAASRKTSREFGEALKAGNEQAIKESFVPINRIFQENGLGFEAGMNRKDDRWDPSRARELCREIAAGLRSLN